MNIIPTTLLILFFIIFLFMIFINYNLLFSIKKYNLNMLKLYFFNFLVFILIIFIFRFYITFELKFLMQVKGDTKTYLINGNNLVTEVSIFSDTIVILCLITILISWIYLSERFLLTLQISIFYFFIFIIFTINMVYTTNLLIMFIFFEFIFTPSLYFVYVLGYAKKTEKTIKYLLIWTLTGSFLVLSGLAYFYNCVGNLNINFTYWQFLSSFEQHMLYCCFFIGFGIKIPLWPFHYWLTKVHVEAPTGFSIFLSGYLVKTAFFCLSYFFILLKTMWLQYISIGIVLWGVLDSSFRMWTATDIKRLIAFATIQEMNLILCLLLLLNNSNFKFLNLFILVHGILSSLLFFLIDQVQKRFQTRNLITLSGLAYKYPLLHNIIWAAILIFRGFPIFIKFFIEWELLTLLLNNFNFFGFFIFFTFSTFAVLGFCRIWFSLLYGQPSEQLINIVDLLKKDTYAGYFLISALMYLNYIVILF